MDKKARELMYRSLDNPLTREEQERLDFALASSPELRHENTLLLAQRQALDSGAVRSFGPFFAEKVVSRVTALRSGNGFESFYDSLLFAFRRFAVVGGLIMLILFAYNLSTGNSLNSEELLFASDFTMQEILELPLF